MIVTIFSVMMREVMGLQEPPSFFSSLPAGVQKIVGRRSTVPSNQGYSVAVSSAGVAVVGGLTHNNNFGGIWIFNLTTNDEWVEVAQINSTSTDLTAGSYFGCSVAISDDGATIAAGAFGDESLAGSVVIFARVSGVWQQQGPKLSAADRAYGSFGSRQGYSVAISADGNTVVSGAYTDNNANGCAMVFRRNPSTSTWSQVGTKLFGSGGVNTVAQQGVSVAISADASTVLVGGPYDNFEVGAVWIYTRVIAGTYSQSVKITPVPGPAYAQFGRGLAIDATGENLVAGAYNDTLFTGAAYVFTKSQLNVWSQQQKLVGTGITGPYAAQGLTVSICGDGNYIIVGGDADDFDTGAVWAFFRNPAETTWRQVGQKVPAPATAIGKSLFAISVSLSSDCSLLAVGGQRDDSQRGASWIYRAAGSCRRPVDDAVVLFSSSCDPTLLNNTACSPSCSTGYQSSGVLLCKNGELIFPAGDICIPLNCSFPAASTIQYNTSSCRGSDYSRNTLTHASSCTPSCISGYTPSSSPGLSLSCSLGVTSTTGSCSPSACVTPADTASTIYGVACGGSSFAHNSDCLPVCANGYSAVGSVQISCAFGSIVGPVGSCVANSCDRPGDTPSTIYSSGCPNSTILSGITCQASCNTDFEIDGGSGELIDISCFAGVVTQSGTCVAVSKKSPSLLSENEKIAIIVPSVLASVAGLAYTIYQFIQSRKEKKANGGEMQNV